MIHIFDNVIDEKLLEEYLTTIENHYNKMSVLNDRYRNPDGHVNFYPTRNVQLKPDNVIVDSIKNYLESKIKVKLTCYDVELQTWPIDSWSKVHNHSTDSLRVTGDYNSLLYLNDGFLGGEFYTSNGIMIQPKKNRLTFFNGNDIDHGVKPVMEKHRYTIIFWWKNTKFY